MRHMAARPPKVPPAMAPVFDERDCEDGEDVEDTEDGTEDEDDEGLEPVFVDTAFSKNF